MKALLQRVQHASVQVDGEMVGAIGQGMLVLLGIEPADDISAVEKMIDRVINYRIFADENDKMNLSLKEVSGELLLVSQFTLAADTTRGRRPSFTSAAPPDQAEPLYNYALNYAQQQGVITKPGLFGGDMKVSLLNDGPVTFWLESK